MFRLGGLGGGRLGLCGSFGSSLGEDFAGGDEGGSKVGMLSARDRGSPVFGSIQGRGESAQMGPIGFCGDGGDGSGDRACRPLGPQVILLGSFWGLELHQAVGSRATPKVDCRGMAQALYPWDME